MRIPNKLKIGGHIVKVEIANLRPELDGEFNGDKNIISISKSIPQSRKEATLIHEILHAMNATLGETSTGHIFLDSLSEQLYQVLKDNHLLK